MFVVVDLNKKLYLCANSRVGSCYVSFFLKKKGLNINLKLIFN